MTSSYIEGGGFFEQLDCECRFGSSAVVRRLLLFLSCRSSMRKYKRFRLRKTTINFPGLITNYVLVLAKMCLVSRPPAET